MGAMAQNHIFIKAREGTSLPSDLRDLLVDDQGRFTYANVYSPDLEPLERLGEDNKVGEVQADTLSLDLYTLGQAPTGWLTHFASLHPDLIIENDFIVDDWYGIQRWSGGELVQNDDFDTNPERTGFFWGAWDDLDDDDEDYDEDEADDDDSDFNNEEAEETARELYQALALYDPLAIMNSLFEARGLFDFFEIESPSEEFVRVAILANRSARILYGMLHDNKDIDIIPLTQTFTCDVEAGIERNRTDVLEFVEEVALKTGSMISLRTHQETERDLNGCKERANASA
jgi:hypothetical protein